MIYDNLIIETELLQGRLITEHVSQQTERSAFFDKQTLPVFMGLISACSPHIQQPFCPLIRWVLQTATCHSQIIETIHQFVTIIFRFH